MRIFVCLSLLLSVFLLAFFCTCSSTSTPVSFRIPVLCHAKRSSFMMASPPRTSREISVGDAFCTYDIESHAVSKSAMAVIAREYLPANKRTSSESACRIFSTAYRCARTVPPCVRRLQTRSTQ